MLESARRRHLDLAGLDDDTEDVIELDGDPARLDPGLAGPGVEFSRAVLVPSDGRQRHGLNFTLQASLVPELTLTYGADRADIQARMT